VDAKASELQRQIAVLTSKCEQHAAEAREWHKVSQRLSAELVWTRQERDMYRWKMEREMTQIGNPR
jgi:flagellar biosynthesis chaperone FliJ